MRLLMSCMSSGMLCDNQVFWTLFECKLQK
jgi:hypothetical protein